MGKRITTVIVAIALLASTLLFAGCGSKQTIGNIDDNTETVDLGYTDADFDNKLPDLKAEVEITDYKKIAENENLELYYRDFNTASQKVESSIAVRDKKNGYVWYSAVPEHKLSQEAQADMPPLSKDSMRSLLVVKFAQLNLNNTTEEPKAIMTMMSEDNSTVKYMAIENGIRIKYSIPRYAFEIVVEIKLDGDSLDVKVPYQAIKEGVGSKEWIDKKLTFIKEYSKTLDDLRNEISKDGELKNKSIKKRLKELNREASELNQLINGIKDALGLEDVANRLQQIFTKLDSLLYGGVNVTGLNRLIDTDTIASKATKAKYASKFDELEGKSMTATLTVASLKTHKVATISYIEIMPFFGAANDTDEGYVLYPDGSGAISYFKEDRPQSWSDSFTKEAYGEKAASGFIDWELVRDNSGERRVYLPVFGIKDGNNAIISTITSGDANAFVNYQPSGFILPMNRTFASFTTKNQIESAVSSEGSYGRAGARFERKFIPTDYAVKVMFLNEDKADYSGMAERYRQYLLDKGDIQKSPAVTDKMPVTIDLLMGISEERLLIDKFIPMTTFEDAANLLKYLKDNGVENVLLNLHGWTKDGYYRYPSSNIPAPKLGGVKGLKELMKVAEETGARVYLQDNYIDIHTRNNGPNTKATAIGSDGRIFANSGRYINLYSPRSIDERFNKEILPEIVDYGVDGVTFDRLGTFIYLDYQKDKHYQRFDTVGFFQNMMAQSDKQLGGSAVIGGNAYTLKYADWLLNIPNGSTNYLYSDEEVPFYQMVVHGLIPYSSSSMYNQFFDRDYQVLKMIEYGDNPFFRLTKLGTEELRDTGYDSLFSSRIDEWKDDVVEIYKEYADNLSALADNYMVEHEILTKDLVRVSYSDGTKIYLNYSQSDTNYEGQTVKAMDYLVVK